MSFRAEQARFCALRLNMMVALYTPAVGVPLGPVGVSAAGGGGGGAGEEQLRVGLLQRGRRPTSAQRALEEAWGMPIVCSNANEDNRWCRGKCIGQVCAALGSCVAQADSGRGRSQTR